MIIFIDTTLRCAITFDVISFHYGFDARATYYSRQTGSQPRYTDRCALGAILCQLANTGSGCAVLHYLQFRKKCLPKNAA